jgi:hypothetical protein
VPLILFSCIATKAIQYVFALMPAFALLTGVALAKISWNRPVSIAAKALALGIVALGLIQMGAITHPNETFRRAFYTIPKPLRIPWQKRAPELPKKGRREMAKTIFSHLPQNDRPGLLFYFPGQWTGNKLTHAMPEFPVSAIYWAQHIQIWLDYLNPNIVFILVDLPYAQSMPWFLPKEDLFAWSPSNRQALSEAHAHIFSGSARMPMNELMHHIASDRQIFDDVVNAVGTLPGQTFDEIPFAANTTIRFTRFEYTPPDVD